MLLYMFRNCVYGCGVPMCGSGGLDNVAIFSSSCDVQSGIDGYCRYVLHIVVEGLIVTTNA